MGRCRAYLDDNQCDQASQHFGQHRHGRKNQPPLHWAALEPMKPGTYGECYPPDRQEGEWGSLERDWAKTPLDWEREMEEIKANARQAIASGHARFMAIQGRLEERFVAAHPIQTQQ